MAEKGRGQKLRAGCEKEENFQDYPFFPSLSLISSLRPATKDLDEAKSDDRSVEIISDDDCSIEIISELEFSRSDKGNEEVQSCSSDNHMHAFRYVDGKRVKAEFAPVLRQIFNEYGNIARGSDVKSPVLLSNLLERICHIYLRLELGKYVDLTLTELQGFVSEIRLFERRKLRVGWIFQRVEKYITHIRANEDTSSASAEAEAEGRNDTSSTLNVKVEPMLRRSARPTSMPKKLKVYVCAAVHKKKRGGKKN